MNSPTTFLTTIFPNSLRKDIMMDKQISVDALRFRRQHNLSTVNRRGLTPLACGLLSLQWLGCASLSRSLPSQFRPNLLK